MSSRAQGHKPRFVLLPGGSSSITLTSMSAYRMSASVRGMASPTSRARRTFLPFPPAARCITPNRCCSSAIARPSDLNDTPSCISACVPTITSASPLAMRSAAASFSFRHAPDRKATSGPSPRKRLRGTVMLACEELRRRHEGRLPAGARRRVGAKERDHRLTEPTSPGRGAPSLPVFACRRDLSSTRAARRSANTGGFRIWQAPGPCPTWGASPRPARLKRSISSASWNTSSRLERHAFPGSRRPSSENGRF